MMVARASVSKHRDIRRVPGQYSRLSRIEKEPVLSEMSAPNGPRQNLHDLTGGHELPMFAASRMAEFAGIRTKNGLQPFGNQ
jgi:hypothetical protein